MNPPSEDIADVLVLSSSALSLTLGTDLFVGEEPHNPDNCVTVFDSPGAAPEPGYVLLYPGVQIRVRGAAIGGYKTAYTLAESIRNVLHALSPQTVNSTKYINVLAEGDILYIGQDKSKRPRFTINFSIMRGDI